MGPGLVTVVVAAQELLLPGDVGGPELALVGSPTGPDTPGRAHWPAGGLTVLRMTADLTAVAVAMVLAFLVKAWLPGTDPSAAAETHLALGLLSLPVWTVMFFRRRLYSEPHMAGRLEEFRRLVQGTLASVGVVAAAAFLLKLYVSRGWLVLLIPLVIALAEAEREVGKRVMGRLRAGGRHLTRVVIVGGNAEALSLCAVLAATPTLGYNPLGFVADGELDGSRAGGHAVLGGLDEAEDVIRRVGATAAILATTSLDPATSNRLTRRLTEAGITVELSSSLRDIASSRLLVRPLGCFPMVHVEPVRRSGWRSLAKRTFDVVVAGLTALAMSPLLLLAALAIKLDSKGKVLFRQQRVGQNGVPFQVFKLRTMVLDAEERATALREANQADGPLFKLRKDPRVTTVGRVLRALSIDEFPQLLNVLRGEMSLVGPRPALPSEISGWSPELHHRLAVKPGMTGMWQVSGSQRWVSFDEYARLDLYYVDNWSIWTDIAILAKTAPAMLFNRGTTS